MPAGVYTYGNGELVKNLLHRHEMLKRRKMPWMTLYQALSQYVMLRKQYFTTDQSEGPFLVNTVFDATALHAAHSMASSLLGQIWPNPFESVEFTPQIAQAEEAFSDAYDMMNTVNEVLPTNLAGAETGVMTAFHEALVDLVVYGVAALFVQETGELRTPIRVKAMDAKTMSFDENDAGIIDTVYMERTYTISQLIKKYGYANVSEHSRQLYDSSGQMLDQKVRVLHAIEPRMERNPLRLGNHDMPFCSIHIEIDQKHMLQESGFEEMPIIVVRFWKNVGEVQGRSPAMDALPDIRAVNKLVEIFERTGEMALDPPKMISSEDVLGAGKAPWYPGAWIPIHASGRLGSDRRPIEVIQTTENPGWATQRISDLRNTIMQHFMDDVLSDLNNTSRQTLGEADIRNEMRQYKVGPMLIRLLIEMVSPFIDRAFNILLQAGFFGVVEGSEQDFELQLAGITPKYLSEDFIQSRASGLKGYRLNFISPAARLMKLEEAQGTERLTNYVAAVSQFKPEVLDNVNFDESARAMQRLGGASQKLLYSPEQVERMRRDRAQAQAQQQEIEQQMAGAAAFKDAAKGVKDLSGGTAA
jgi:hypothetical protein